MTVYDLSLHKQDHARIAEHEDAYISVVTLTNSSANSSSFNVFDENEFSSFVEDTDWKYLITPKNIVFTPSDGRFTVTYGGRYLISIASIWGIGVSDDVISALWKNGSSLYSVNQYSDVGAGNPSSTPLSCILQLSAGDYLELKITPLSGSCRGEKGTSMSIDRLGN